jgi:hypothetical protein
MQAGRLDSKSERPTNSFPYWHSTGTISKNSYKFYQQVEPVGTYFEMSWHGTACVDELQEKYRNNFFNLFFVLIVLHLIYFKSQKIILINC